MVRQKDHFISHKIILSGLRLTVNYSDDYGDELLWKDFNDISDTFRAKLQFLSSFWV